MIPAYTSPPSRLDSQLIFPLLPPKKTNRRLQAKSEQNDAVERRVGVTMATTSKAFGVSRYLHNAVGIPQQQSAEAKRRAQGSGCRQRPHRSSPPHQRYWYAYTGDSARNNIAKRGEEGDGSRHSSNGGSQHSSHR
eukprot:m.212132 g.212132  ORF g.212132 m.212132 type:complete len:136 (+) comp16944_c16_seq5:753-1160(+)